MNKVFLLETMLVLAVALSGCVQPDEKACQADGDCACGVHYQTGDCFAGNKAFVDTSRQCPDFCTGITETFETRCVEGECKAIES